MAKIIEVKKLPVPKFESVVIQLDYEEAITLVSILGKIGGDPITTRRKYLDRMWSALQSTGVQYDPNCLMGSLHFTDK